jgi:hypothetical protein
MEIRYSYVKKHFFLLQFTLNDWLSFSQNNNSVALAFNFAFDLFLQQYEYTYQ